MTPIRQRMSPKRTAGPSPIMFFHQLFAQKRLVLDCRRSENLVHDDDGPRRRLIENIVNSDQVVLQLAAEIFDLLFSFKMREQLVEKEELRLPARNGTADAGQIMQLAECTGERGLSALVGTGYDQYPFLALEVKVVAYDRRILPQ